MHNLDGVYTCMFCGRAGHLDKFCFQRRRHEYARNSYHDEFLDLSPRSYSRVSPHSYSHASPHIFYVLCLGSPTDLTIAHMVLVHKRIALSLDVLVTTHVLIMVIVSHVGLVFLLEGPTPTSSRDT
jgi:hypothetical protein